MEYFKKNPTGYARRILLAVAGTTPQILTETLYALTQSVQPYIPTEVHVITTSEGAHRIRLQLLDEHTGRFHQFCRDYGLTGRIVFTSENVTLLHDASGLPLADIVSPRDNELAADQIVSWLRSFAQDGECAIHACLAGGRKTMGFYLGYGLSLYGREQDRLSHVLVSPHFEGNRDFFYKPPVAQTLYSSAFVGGRVDDRPLSTEDAEIWLAEIPFVRLRDGLPANLLGGKGSYTNAVQAVQSSLPDNNLLVDFQRHELVCGGVPVKLPPREFAFYAWHARRRTELFENAPVGWKDTLGEDEPVMKAYFRVYLETLGGDDLHPDYLAAQRAYCNGFDKDTWAGNVHHVNRRIRSTLGVHHGKPFELCARRIGSQSRLSVYWLDYPAERINLLANKAKSN